MCDVNTVMHQYITCRSPASYVVPHIMGQWSNSFTFHEIKMWNELPFEAQSKQQHNYKRNLRTINESNESDSEN